jgi:hypothetical protein
LRRRDLLSGKDFIFWNSDRRDWLGADFYWGWLWFRF